MKTFITFSDGHNSDELAIVLEKSISIFSKHPLRIYRKEDFDVKYDSDWSASGKGHFYKIISCLKAMEEYDDEIVWIDTDCVVTNYIDKIWFESWRINSYPLLPKYRFNLFQKELGSGFNLPDVSENWFLESGKNKVGVSVVNRKFYSQACFMLFNHSCKAFFEETLSYSENNDVDCFPYADESIINCLLWKYEFNDCLGDIFLCSYYFGYEIIDIMSLKDRDSFMEHLFDRNHKPLYNIFDNILFLHGNKSSKVASDILDSLVSNRLKN